MCRPTGPHRVTKCLQFVSSGLLECGEILDRLIDIAPKRAESVALVSGDITAGAEEGDKGVPQCLRARLIGPKALVLSVRKAGDCLGAGGYCRPPVLDVLPSLGMLVGIESDVSHGAPPA